MKTGQGFVLVYDITSATSFDLATKLRTQIIRLKEDTPDVMFPHAINSHKLQIPTILVGNKCDLEKIRKVPKEKAQAFATQHRMGFIEGMLVPSPYLLSMHLLFVVTSTCELD